MLLRFEPSELKISFYKTVLGKTKIPSDARHFSPAFVYFCYQRSMMLGCQQQQHDQLMITCLSAPTVLISILFTSVPSPGSRLLSQSCYL